METISDGLEFDDEEFGKYYIMSVMEKPHRFSQSLYWQLQADYYQKLGFSAFSSGDVPFRSSSNPLIAKSYAELIRGYMRDLASDPIYLSKVKKRVVILELGGGTGQFGFHLIKALLRLTNGLIPDKLPTFCYLITDLAPSNVKAWLDHPKLKPLVEKGILECATLDCGDPLQAKLQVSDKSLAEYIDGDPVVVIANYLLDVLVNDAFRVEDNKLYAVQVGIDVDGPILEPDSSLDFFETVRFSNTNVPVSLPYYEEPLFNSIIEEYLDILTTSTFLFPVVALRFLDSLRKLAGDRLFLVVGDMALSNISHLEGRNKIGMALNGSFASKVNLDAVSRWVQHNSGISLIPNTPSRHFDTYGFILGHHGECSETLIAFDHHSGQCGSSEYGALIRRAAKHQKEPFTPRQLIGLLHSSHLDPYIIVTLIEPLIATAEIARSYERAAMAAAVKTCWDNYYDVGEKKDLAYHIGRALKYLGQPEMALECYQHSLDKHGPNRRVLNSMGYCCNKIGDYAQSLHYYSQSFELNPNKHAQTKIKNLTAILENDKITP